MKITYNLLIILILSALPLAGSARGSDMIKIPKGEFQSFFKGEGLDKIKLPSFYIDKYAVTNSDFNDFLKKQPRYIKSKVPGLFANEYYLKHWNSDYLSKSKLKTIGKKPVTNVPWFVARKYCASKGKRLPNISEWEYASDGQNPKNEKIILEWYGKTNENYKLDEVKNSAVNKYGVYGMHGQLWELVEDFISVMISSDSRSGGDRTDGFFCGGGSISSKDASKYATFMRYAYRSSLRGNYSAQNVGFRCMREIK